LHYLLAFSGSASDKFFSIITRHVQLACDTFTGVSRPVLLMTVGSADYEKTKREVVVRVVDKMPEFANKLEEYTDQALVCEIRVR
jgi:hypothetical protein